MTLSSLIRRADTPNEIMTSLPPALRPFLAVLLLAALAGCKAKERERYTPGTATIVRGVNMTDVKVALAARIDSSKAPSWVTPDRWKRVKKLYESFGTVPLWLESDGVKQRGDDLLKAIEEAPTHALTTESYPLDSIKAVVQADNVMKTATAQALADADVLLTAAYVAYASDMLIGQVDPKTVSQSWNIPARVSEVDSSLVRGLTQRPTPSSSSTALPQRIRARRSGCRQSGICGRRRGRRSTTSSLHLQRRSPTRRTACVSRRWRSSSRWGRQHGRPCRRCRGSRRNGQPRTLRICFGKPLPRSVVRLRRPEDVRRARLVTLEAA